MSYIFEKHVMTTPYEYSNERVNDVIPSQFSIHVTDRNDRYMYLTLCGYEILTTPNFFPHLKFRGAGRLAAAGSGTSC